MCEVGKKKKVVQSLNVCSSWESIFVIVVVKIAVANDWFHEDKTSSKNRAYFNTSRTTVASTLSSPNLHSHFIFLRSSLTPKHLTSLISPTSIMFFYFLKKQTTMNCKDPSMKTSLPSFKACALWIRHKRKKNETEKR